MIVESYDLSLTRRVMETKSKTTANKKLYAGWILIGLVQTDTGFLYCLALPRKAERKSEVEPVPSKRPFINLLD